MTVDYVEICGQMYEIVGHPAPLVRNGRVLDCYVDHEGRQVLFSNDLPYPSLIGIVANAVSLAWQEKGTAPLPFAGAVS